MPGHANGGGNLRSIACVTSDNHGGGLLLLTELRRVDNSVHGDLVALVNAQNKFTAFCPHTYIWCEVHRCKCNWFAFLMIHKLHVAGSYLFGYIYRIGLHVVGKLKPAACLNRNFRSRYDFGRILRYGRVVVMIISKGKLQVSSMYSLTIHLK